MFRCGQLKKFYETIWHGIPFSTLAGVNRDRVAGEDFYETFYHAFFNKHRDWNSLDPAWIGYKLKVAEFILGRIPGNNAPILSMGCGLGFVEKHLIESGVRGLEINDSSITSLRWLRPLIDESRIHLGRVPECLPPGRRYELIYLSGVDYCFDNAALTACLGAIRARLAPAGACLVVSGSFDPGGLDRNVRFLVRRTLESLGMIDARGQLWGYLRTRREYRAVMRDAGYTHVDDGFLANGAYWIEGKLV